MSYNGSGTFLINTSGQPVVTGTPISSTVFNALTADLATGLSTAITKDGQTATTARIPFAAGINSTLVTDSTSTTTGSIITAGGAGVAKALFVGTTANVAGAVTLQSTLGVTGITTFSAQPIFSSLTASSAVATDASKGLVSVTNTGTGNNVLATSPTLTGTIAGASLSLSSLTSGRVPYATTAGLLTDSANLLYSGTDLGVYGLTVGRGAGAVSTNTAFGVSALVNNTSGGGNAALSRLALAGNTTGNDNTSAGNSALQANTTGSANTAFGSQALTANTTASNNTAVGYQAGFSNTTGASNAFLGRGAGYSLTGAYSNNTAVGDAALFYTTGGADNTAIGQYALGGATTGASNTAIGSGAGSNLTTGSKNTLIGRYNGNQGGLDIRTAGNYIVLSDGDANIRGIFDNNGNFLVGAISQIATVSRFTLGVPNNSQWGISMKATDSNAGYRAINFANFSSTNIGSIDCTTSATSYSTSSDYRLKEDIAPMTGALAKVALLKPVTYKWKATGESTQGFIAHELAEIVPECVVGEKDAVDANGNPEYQGIDTSFLVATLTAAIQEQQALITALTTRITALEAA